MKYCVNTSYYSYYEPRSNAKAMLGITYKTRNENGKYDNKETQKHTMFSAFIVPTRQSLNHLPFIIFLHLN
jgi:hypothetical protein